MYIAIFLILICIQYPLTQLEAHPDELMSVVLISQNNPYYFLAEIGKDFSPPLFHSFMKLFSLFTKVNVTLIRYINVLLYALSSVVLMKSIDYVSIKKTLLSKLVIGLSFCFSLGALNLVTQARSNSLAILFSSLSVLFILKVLKYNNIRDKKLLCAIFLLGSLVHYYSLMLNCCLLIAFLSFFRKKGLKYYLVSLVPSFVWAAVFFVKYMYGDGAHWIEQVSVESFVRTLSYPFESLVITIVLSGIILSVALSKKSEFDIYLKRFLMAIALLFLISFFVSLAGVHIFLDRYFMVIYPIFFLLIGLSCQLVRMRGAVVVTFALLLNFSGSYGGLLKDRSSLGKMVEHIEHEKIVYSYKIHHKILVNLGIKESTIRELKGTDLKLIKGSYILIYEERSDHLKDAVKSISANNSIDLVDSGASTYLYKIPAT